MARMTRLRAPRTAQNAGTVGVDTDGAQDR